MDATMARSCHWWAQFDFESLKCSGHRIKLTCYQLKMMKLSKWLEILGKLLSQLRISVVHARYKQNPMAGIAS